MCMYVCECVVNFINRKHTHTAIHANLRNALKTRFRPCQDYNLSFSFPYGIAISVSSNGFAYDFPCLLKTNNK